MPGGAARAVAVVAAAYLGAVPLSSESPSPGQLAHHAQEPAIFTFRAGFWLHLHHFLYVLGRAEMGTRDSSRRAVAGAGADQADGLASATPEERTVWQSAVAAYAAGLSRLDIVFDRELWQITGSLAGLDEWDEITVVGVPGPVRDALERAAPVYRRLWWPAHGRGSRTYVDELQTRLRLDGSVIVSIMARAFGERWPAAGYPVNVSAYANWAGAYSTGDRLLVIASRDSGLAGTLGLETLFHEAAHQWDEAIEAKLRAAATRRGGVRVWQGLSHALLFYTAGEAVRRAIPPHTPYAEANGMWANGPMARFKVPLDTYWRPYLRRGTGLEDALESLVVAAQ